MRNIAAIMRSPLFSNLEEAEVIQALDCFQATERAFWKQEYILNAGDPAATIGVILSGTVSIVSNDFWGNRTIIEQLGPGSTLAETILFSTTDTLPFSAMAAERSELLLFNSRHITAPCSRLCSWHAAIMHNLLTIIADKGLLFARKIAHLSKRSTREKLLSFLSAQARLAGSSRFTIHLNRQELADYLCVDRSAMSSQLSRLRDEGILEYRRNQFTLLAEDDA